MRSLFQGKGLQLGQSFGIDHNPVFCCCLHERTSTGVPAGIVHTNRPRVGGTQEKRVLRGTNLGAKKRKKRARRCSVTPEAAGSSPVRPAPKSPESLASGLLVFCTTAGNCPKSGTIPLGVLSARMRST